MCEQNSPWEGSFLSGVNNCDKVSLYGSVIIVWKNKVLIKGVTLIEKGQYLKVFTHFEQGKGLVTTKAFYS